MKITDNRTITIEIDGTEHEVSLADAQRLYDLLGDVSGITRHFAISPTWPNRYAGSIQVESPGVAINNHRTTTAGPGVAINNHRTTTAGSKVV